MITCASQSDSEGPYVAVMDGDWPSTTIGGGAPGIQAHGQFVCHIQKSKSASMLLVHPNLAAVVADDTGQRDLRLR